MTDDLKCPECGSDDIHTAYCGNPEHNVVCMPCGHCFFDQTTQDIWDAELNELTEQHE